MWFKFRYISYIVLAFSLSGCQSIEKPIDNAVYKIFDTLDGPDGVDSSDGKLCLFATTKTKWVKNGKKVVRVHYSARSWIDETVDEEAKKRGLSCGVGQDEFFHNDTLYGDSRKLKLVNLSNEVLCNVITMSEDGSISPVPTHVQEAEKRNLPCAKIANIALGGEVEEAKTDTSVSPKVQKNTELPKIEMTNDPWTARVRSYVYK